MTIHTKYYDSKDLQKAIRYANRYLTTWPTVAENRFTGMLIVTDDLRIIADMQTKPDLFRIVWQYEK